MKLNLSTRIVCPACNGSSFTAKYEATYLYSYSIDSNAPGLKNDEEFLPFLFDNRKLLESRQYIECNVCGSRYLCSFNEGNRGVDLIILQKAIRSYYVSNPEFLG